MTFSNSQGFGLKLNEIPVEQINGTVRINRDKGTMFIIEILQKNG